MELGRLKYRVLLFILAIAPVIPVSSSVIESACYNLTFTARPSINLSFQTNTYNPELKINTDSVVIPLKRAGRLLLIEAKVGDETGNLVLIQVPTDWCLIAPISEIMLDREVQHQPELQELLELSNKYS